MKRCLLLSILLLLLAHATFGQDKPKLIGEIEFFGYSGIDLNKVRAALPFHEKENFTEEVSVESLEHLANAIKHVIGQFPTNEANVCCDSQGNWIIFIGLSGKAILYNRPPSGRIRLPQKALA